MTALATPLRGTKLSADRQRRLARLESEIKSDLAAMRPLMVRIGTNLATIRDAGLYLAHAETFEAYCKDRWDIDRSYAYRLISSARVVRNLESGGLRVLPRIESQTRPLVGLDPEQQRAAWSEATKSAEGRQPTGKQVQEAVAKVAPPSADRVAAEVAQLIAEFRKGIRHAIAAHRKLVRIRAAGLPPDARRQRRETLQRQRVILKAITQGGGQ